MRPACATWSVWPKIYEAFRRVVIGGRLLRITGRLQREQGIIHLIAATVEDHSPMLGMLGDLGAEAIDPTEGRGDEARRPVALRELPGNHPLVGPARCAACGIRAIRPRRCSPAGISTETGAAAMQRCAVAGAKHLSGWQNERTVSPKGRPIGDCPCG